ncbi:MAG: choice-of-anchor D domain-containing protein [Verrucomicrobiales bacterium]
MKHLIPSLSLALAIALTVRPSSAGAVPPGPTPQLTSVDHVPEGLAKSDWQSIRAAYEAGRHAFQPIEGGWQARNPGQQWTTKFDGRGFVAHPKDGDWTWGLELQSYGFGEKQRVIREVPAVKAEGQRLTYDWDATVQEWFVNDARGLEHGFTVRERPAVSPASPESPLSFTLSTRGTLHPCVSPGAQGVLFADASGATVLNYTGLKVWDADGKVLASRFEAAGEKAVRLVVDERGARYPLTIDPIAQQAYLKPAAVGTSQHFDQFGRSVAVSGDTVVVGAFWEDSSTTGVNSTPNESAGISGAAYVFVRSAGVWTQQAYLKPAAVGTTQASDQFGYSVAVWGDTVVVGANGEDSSTTGVNSTPNESAYNSGAAYVFVRSAGVWTQQAYLKPAAVGTSQAPDGFGISVAVSGDTVVVGAHGEASSTTGVNSTPDESARGAGAAYVFVRSAGVWTQQAYLKPAAVGTTQAGDQFGFSVAVSGDTMVVGAVREASFATGVNSTPNESAPSSGAAYVFVRSAGVWTQQAYLKPASVGTTQVGDQFGYSVAVSGDTVVVGALFEDSSTTGVNSTPNDSGDRPVGDFRFESGAAYVFVRSAGVWTQQAYLKPAAVGTSQAGDWFGSSVAISGETVVVGALFESSSTTGVNSTPNESAAFSGAAYVFVRSAGVWTQQAYLKPASVGTTQVGDRFGVSVAVSGDTVVVGASGEDSSTTGVNSTPNENTYDPTADYAGSGAAYVFAPFPTVTTPTSASITTTTAMLGGNVTGDGGATIGGRGVVFAPTATDADPIIGDVGVTVVPASGTTGVFSIPVTGLTPGTAYTFKAYAISTFGTAYSSVASFTALIPEIAVEHPAGTSLTAGTGSVAFGTRPPGSPGAAKVFTLRNLGTSDLTITTPAVTGGNAGDFSVNNTGTLLAIPSGQQTTFSVTFTSSASGARSTTLSIANNDPDENPFHIALIGTGLLVTQDSDGDGMKDVAEFNLSALGFDWQVAQPSLVGALASGAESAGYFTTAQVQALNLEVPLLTKNAGTGKFKLTIGVQKTTNLAQPFLEFPMNMPGSTMTINGAGKLEFEFTVPDNAAFFRLEAQ